MEIKNTTENSDVVTLLYKACAEVQGFEENHIVCQAWGKDAQF